MAFILQITTQPALRHSAYDMWVWLNSSIAAVCFLELWYCHPWPSTSVETTGNQEQLSLVLLMKWNRSPLQTIHMVIVGFKKKVSDAVGLD